MKFKLGIIGGIGSDSSAYFYNLILNKTNVSCDQDHIDMVLLNAASMPDRTKHILGETEESPIQDLKSSIKILEDIGVNDIFMVCNTAHFYFDELQKSTSINIVNMIEETAKYLSKKYKKIGLLSTTGTVEAKIYSDVFDKYDMDIIYSDSQDDVMTIIYDEVKVGKKPSRDLFEKLSSDLKAKGAEIIILGCTELSILKELFNLSDGFIDPLEIVAEALISKHSKRGVRR